jgi:hypothetical protein
LDFCHCGKSSRISAGSQFKPSLENYFAAAAVTMSSPMARWSFARAVS